MLKPYRKAEVSFEEKREIVGAGENSRSWIAHDNQLDCEIFVKQIATHYLTEDEFFLEASILHKSSHPNVAQIMYACKDCNYIYLVSPFYKNGSLQDKIENDFLTSKEIIKFSIETLCGLNNIHSKGLCHFDIKPANILISDRNEALLSDFGLASFVENDGTAKINGSYGIHEPPEFDGNEKATVAADIYQFGLTMYRMCVGHEEFSAQVVNLSEVNDAYKFIKDGHFPDRKKFPLHIGNGIQKIVKKCLIPDPSCRYQSCIDILNDLSKLEGDNLEWKYCQIKEERKEVWIRGEGTAKVKVTRYLDSGECTTVGGIAERRKNKFCIKKDASDKQVRKILMEA